MNTHSQISAGLAKLGIFLRTSDWRQSGKLGLTATQKQVLVHLSHRGPARISSVAEAIGVRQPTATEALTPLVRKGLVERKPDPLDARARILRLTEDGRAAVDELVAWPDALVKAIESLDHSERATLLRALTTIVQRLQTSGEIPIQKMCVGCRFFRPHAHAGAKPHHCDFVDAAFGDAELRLECGEHEPASAARADSNFDLFRARELQ